MGNTAKKPEDMTWDDIRATLAEATLLSKENEKGLKELKKAVDRTVEAVERTEKTVAETSKAVFGVNKEREASLEKLEKAVAETTKAVFGVNKEREASLEKLEKAVAETTKAVFGVDKKVNGIGDSNGMLAEDYFYESLNKTKTLGGLHFDIVSRNMKGALKLEDGTTLDEEYDTVMINDTAVCVVEVKYKVEKQDINRLAKKRVHNFKKLFPMYANYKIYLAFGGLTFQKGAVDVANELGLGVLRLNGDAVEIYDDNLKAY